MMSVSFSDRSIAAMLLLAVFLTVIAFSPGCSPQATPQSVSQPQWPPVVEFVSAEVSGKLELSTPAGPVTVDLSSSMVSGEGELELLGADVDAKVAFAVNGARQEVHIGSPGRPSAEGWAQCLSADISAELIPGLAVVIKARPPGLNALCGPAMLDIQTPLGRWAGTAEPATASE